MNRGPVDSFDVSLRCGFRPNADQVRCTDMCDASVFPASLRPAQRVASFGIVFSVLDHLRNPAVHCGAGPAGRSGVRPKRSSMRLLANCLSHFPTSCARGSGRPRAEAASYAVAATLIADLSGDG